MLRERHWRTLGLRGSFGANLWVCPQCVHAPKVSELLPDIVSLEVFVEGWGIAINPRKPVGMGAAPALPFESMLIIHDVKDLVHRSADTDVKVMDGDMVVIDEVLAGHVVALYQCRC